MPEGDTLYKVAQFIAPRLVGHELSAVRFLGAPVPMLARRRVLSVRSWGKHVLITLTPEGAHGYVVRAHLGMFGTWHSYAAHARMGRPVGTDDLALVRADGHRFICYRPEDAEVLQVCDIPHSKVLGRLGPCLLAATFDHAVLRERINSIHPDTPLIDVLLGQHIASGLGNVYKSELLFLHGLHPLTPKGALSQAWLELLFADGRTLLQRNLGGWSRTITYDRSTCPQHPNLPNYFVYRRAHEACLRCGAKIIRQLWGRHMRSCYYCPTCQPPVVPIGVAACASPMPAPQVSKLP